LIADELYKPQEEVAYPLFGVCSNKPPSHLDTAEMLEAFKHFSFADGSWAKNPKLTEIIRDLNPHLKLLHYRNSYVDAEDAEPAREAIAMTLAARLKEDIDQYEEVFLITRDVNNELSIPIIASSLGSNDYSYPQEGIFVVWITIGDERMKVLNTKASGSDLMEVTVIRGWNGTANVAHLKETPVLSPLYIDDDRPGTDSLRIRYMLDPYYDSGYLVMANLTKDLMMKGSSNPTPFVDGVWYDTFNVGDFNVRNIFGNKATTWNQIENIPYTNQRFRLFREKQIDYIQNFFLNDCEIHSIPFIAANNLKRTYWDENGGMMYFLMKTSVKERPIDGFCMESAFNANRNRDSLKERLEILMHAAQHGLAANPIWENAGSDSIYIENDDDTRKSSESFGYACYLLGVENQEVNLFGTYPFYQDRSGLPPEPPEGYNKLDLVEARIGNKIHEQYFYPIGDRLETRPYVDLEGYRIQPEMAVYKRQFTNGVVFLNLEEQSCNVSLTDSNYVDPETAELISSILLPPLSGKILLYPELSPEESGKTFAIQANNGLFLSNLDGNHLTSKVVEKDISDTELFRVVPVKGGLVALQGTRKNGIKKYIASKRTSEQPLACTFMFARKRAEYKMIKNSDDSYSFLSIMHGKYISLKQDQTVVPDAISICDNEKFRLVPIKTTRD
ncbi:hypothetical protein N9Y92_04690, partial [Chlamydiales bacterium]|nr:hypothetical protein [Chlamydiales bacterium]